MNVTPEAHLIVETKASILSHKFLISIDTPDWNLSKSLSLSE